MSVKRVFLWLFVLTVLLVLLSPSPSLPGQNEKEKKAPTLIATQSATLGQTISIEGKNLTPNITYQIKWSKEGTIVDCQGELSTDSNGSFTGTVTLPRAIVWHGQGRGNLRAQPKGGRSGLQAFAELTIERIELTVPESAQLGQVIEVVGRKFAPRAPYLFKWGRGPRIWDCRGELTTNDQGELHGNITLPPAIHPSEQSVGTTLFVYDKAKGFQHGWVANAPLPVKKVELTMPVAAIMGQVIELAGKNLAPKTPYLFKWGRGPRIWDCRGELTTDDQGELHGNITLPPAIKPLEQQPGRDLFVYDKAKGFVHGWVANVPLPIEQAVLTAPESAALGKNVEVNGAKFASNRIYVFKWGEGNRLWGCKGALKSDDQGKLTGQITLPGIVVCSELGKKTLFAYDQATNDYIAAQRFEIKPVEMQYDENMIRTYLQKGETFELGRYICPPGIIWENEAWHYKPRVSDLTPQTVKPGMHYAYFHCPRSPDEARNYTPPAYYLRIKGESYTPLVIFGPGRKVSGHLILDGSGNIVEDEETLKAVFQTLFILGGENRTSRHLEDEAKYYEERAKEYSKSSKEAIDFAATWGLSERVTLDALSAYFSVQSGDAWGVIGAIASAANTAFLIKDIWDITHHEEPFPDVEKWLQERNDEITVALNVKGIYDVGIIVMKARQAQALPSTFDRMESAAAFFKAGHSRFTAYKDFSKNFKPQLNSAAKSLGVMLVDLAQQKTAVDALAASVHFSKIALVYRKMAETLREATDGIEDEDELRDIRLLSLLACYGSLLERDTAVYLQETFERYIDKDWRGKVYKFCGPRLQRIYGRLPKPEEVEAAAQTAIKRFQENAEYFLMGLDFNCDLAAFEVLGIKERIALKGKQVSFQ